MTHRPLLGAPVVLGLVLLAAPAHAERVDSSWLSYAGMNVSVTPPDEEPFAARVNTPLLSGDRIATGISSRAEAILADGTVVRFDFGTEARFDFLARTYESGDDRTLVTLLCGALAVDARDTDNEERSVRIDTENATVVVPAGAFVRVDDAVLGTAVYVRSGTAQVMGRAGEVMLRPGDSAHVSGELPIDVVRSGLPKDAFTQFLAERAPRLAGPSLRFLRDAALADGEEWDEDAYSYEAALLDAAGSWIYVGTYGQPCFRPRVGPNWRPYSSGRWRWTPSGATWVADEPWGWLTSHFGTWFLDPAFGWCWCPGWDYSPAWVYWNLTEEWLGWCPIGFYSGNDSWTSYGATVNGRHENGWHQLGGLVDVPQIDPRGWSYIARDQIGGRIAREQIVRGDRVGFRAGDTGVISAAPFRFERTPGQPVRGSTTTAPAEVDRGLTAILRREPVLPREAQETLQRSDVIARPMQPVDARVPPSPMRAEAPVRAERPVSPEPTSFVEATRPETERVAPREEPQRADAPRWEPAAAPSEEPQRYEPPPAPRPEPVRVEPAPAPRAEPERHEAPPEPRPEPVRVEPAPAPRAEPERHEAPQPEPAPRTEPAGRSDRRG